MTGCRRVVALAALLLALSAGCGGSQSDDATREAQDIVEQLGSLEEGEIVIQGTSARVYGPYSLKPGGYVLRFEHAGSGDRPKLVVALESKPRSRAAPYQLLVDSRDPSGTRRVTVSGKLYVHVVSAAAGYELRFTPRSS